MWSQRSRLTLPFSSNVSSRSPPTLMHAPSLIPPLPHPSPTSSLGPTAVTPGRSLGLVALSDPKVHVLPSSRCSTRALMERISPQALAGVRQPRERLSRSSRGWVMTQASLLTLYTTRAHEKLARLTLVLRTVDTARRRRTVSDQFHQRNRNQRLGSGPSREPRSRSIPQPRSKLRRPRQLPPFPPFLDHGLLGQKVLLGDTRFGSESDQATWLRGRLHLGGRD
jgi:hypothetical protein